MAEAEDLITDAARHATVFMQDLWRRHAAGPDALQPLAFSDIARRLDLLIAAVFGTSYPLRVAQNPAPVTLLVKLFERHDRPRVSQAIPATDGANIWLPARIDAPDDATILRRFRIVALQQASRAARGSAAAAPALSDALKRDLYLLLEADAADQDLVRLLPGVRAPLNELRRDALSRRPALAEFPAARLPLEELVRQVLRTDCTAPCPELPVSESPARSAELARELAAKVAPDGITGVRPMYKDLWTGDLRPASPARMSAAAGTASSDDDSDDSPTPRGARLDRRPDVREADEDEDKQEPGAWMIQSAQPEQHIEDPMGAQRPTDRDDQTAAEEFADSMSELPEARLVSTPGRPKEVLLSDDPPDARSTSEASSTEEGGLRINYPEWDFRINAYKDAAATVRSMRAPCGPQLWVDKTLDQHHAMLTAIRRRFEMLRSQRVRLRKQLEGDELDLGACIDNYADFRAGLPMADGLYETRRAARRNMAISLLIDTSGSTDGWVSASRRVIDVEREALLLVCIALEGMAEPYSVHAFSGEGPHGVTVREIKRFDEHYDNDVALRIAALEPERYTRAGAALRHVTTMLMQQNAEHRLLLLLSDGKPNDVDHYDGRYGVEDMRQAVNETKLQGISPFCLTIDRQAANYLPAMFGERHYAMLPRPELLPTVLVDWLRRLVVG
ncbi:MAG TPA: VWA domain-containing protein [Woeseiaceae bacterium]|nr:VWA domain-containing protein [Woeseiaceae bacterium]